MYKRNVYNISVWFIKWFEIRLPLPISFESAPGLVFEVSTMLLPRKYSIFHERSHSGCKTFSSGLKFADLLKFRNRKNIQSNPPLVHPTTLPLSLFYSLSLNVKDNIWLFLNKILPLFQSFSCMKWGRQKFLAFYFQLNRQFGSGKRIEYVISQSLPICYHLFAKLYSFTFPLSFEEAEQWNPKEAREVLIFHLEKHFLLPTALGDFMRLSKRRFFSMSQRFSAAPRFQLIPL